MPPSVLALHDWQEYLLPVLVGILYQRTYIHFVGKGIIQKQSACFLP